MPADVRIRVTVRYFAAARAAAGTETEMFDLREGTTVAELIDVLSARDVGCPSAVRRRVVAVSAGMYFVIYVT